MRFLANRLSITATFLGLCMAGSLLGPAVAGNDPPRAGKASSQWADALGDRIFAGWVDKYVQEWQITPAERPFDQIGWAKDIRDAMRLGQKHGRPVFLFTHDGRMAIGRC